MKRIVLGLVMLGVCSGAEPAVDQIRQSMISAYKNIHSIHLVASQEVAMSRPGGVSNSLGSSYEYALQGNHKVMLHLRENGFEAIFVSDGSNTWKALPGEKRWARQEVAVDDDEEPRGAPSGKADLRTTLAARLLVPALTFAKQAREVRRKGEETVKIEGRRVECWVLQGEVNGAAEQFWIDKGSFLAVQSKSKSKTVLQGRGVEIEVSTKLKTLDLNDDVPDSVFTFRPEPKWKETEFLVLPGEERRQLVNVPAANFSLKSLDGEKVSLDDFKGKVIVLDFWATWCGPCRRTMPHLQKLNQELAGRGVVILGLSDEGTGTVKSSVKGAKYDFTILLDSGREVRRRYGIRAIPTTFVIGKDGVIRSHFIGSMSEETLRKAIEAVM